MRPRAGLTLLELVLAMGLASLLFVVLVSVFDTALRLLSRSARARDFADASAALTELLERDLATLCTDPRGDLLADWILLDQDGDGIARLPVQRLRLVRRTSAAESARLFGLDAAREGLVEVAWAALPPQGGADPDAAGERVLLRGVRRPDEAGTSFFDAAFFDALGRPAPGALQELGGGVLWWEVAFRAEGDPLAAPVSAWDAWERGRAELAPGAHAAPAPDAAERRSPSLPRRARIALELEPPRERARRTRLAEPAGADATRLAVVSARLLPEPGVHLLVGEEWLLLVAVDGAIAVVRRGERGTAPVPHAAGALVHFGARAERDIPLEVGGAEWRH